MERLLSPLAHEEYRTLSYLHLSKLWCSEVQNNSLYPHSIIVLYGDKQKPVISQEGHSRCLAEFLHSVFDRCVPLWMEPAFRESGPSEVVSVDIQNHSCTSTQNQSCWEPFLNFIAMSSRPKMTHNSLWIDMLNMIARYCQISLIDMLFVQFFFDRLTHNLSVHCPTFVYHC